MPTVVAKLRWKKSENAENFRFLKPLTAKLPNGNTPQEVTQTHHPKHGRREPPNLNKARREIDSDLAAICGRA